VKPELPPIVKLAEQAAVAIERAVVGWPRFHKYQHGAVLRGQAMGVWQAAVRAWRNRAEQAALIEKLSEQIDDLKLSMQLGRQIGAYRSGGEFEAVYRIVHDLGRQCGGWKKQHAKRLNPAGQQHGQPERPQILSAPGASQEAHV
jgi:hypothetical protein